MITSDFERLLDELSGSASSPPIVEESITDSASLKAVAKRNIDPIAAAKLIDHDYRRFLKTLLRPKVHQSATPCIWQLTRARRFQRDL